MDNVSDMNMIHKNHKRSRDSYEPAAVTTTALSTLFSPVDDISTTEKQAATSSSTQQQQQQQQQVHSTTKSLLSMEEILGVPLEYVFRRFVPAGYHQSRSAARSLLSRTEAQCLIRIRLLAQALDELMHEIKRALHIKVFCREIRDCILDLSMTKQSPLLRPLVPIVHTIGEHCATLHTLQALCSELQLVLSNLSKCAQSLRQYAEQNGSFFESILKCSSETISSPVEAMVVEKQLISDLQEECAQRIDDILVRVQHQQEAEEATSVPGIFSVSMQAFCQDLWSTTESSSLSLSSLPSLSASSASLLLLPLLSIQHHQRTESVSVITGLETKQEYQQQPLDTSTRSSSSSSPVVMDPEEEEGEEKENSQQQYLSNSQQQALRCSVSPSLSSHQQHVRMGGERIELTELPLSQSQGTSTNSSASTSAEA